jgi:hypothetical protein
MANMTVDSLKNNLTNPQRVYLWELIIPQVPGGGDSGTLTIRAQSTSIPAESIEEIKIPFKQTAGVKYAGKAAFPQTWSVTFIEGEDRAISMALKAWKRKVVDARTGLGAGDESYKGNMFLNLLSTKGLITRTIKMEGCYVQDIAEVALDMAATDAVRQAATFSYDLHDDASI